MIKKGVVVVILFLSFILFVSAGTVVQVRMDQDNSNDNYIDGEIRETNNLDSVNNLFRIGDNGGDKYRAFLDFNTTEIPDNAVINNVTLLLTVITGQAFNVNIYALNETARSLSGSGATLNARCAGTGSTDVFSGSDPFNVAAIPINITLGTPANGILQSNLTNDFFTVCIKRTDEATVDGAFVEIHSNESATASARPVLIVDYSVLDATAPLVTIVNPTNKTYNAAEVAAGIPFNVSLNENGSVMYSLDNGLNNLSMTGNESYLFGTGFNATNNSIASGSYTFRVYANDTAGNRNDTESVVFSVDASGPEVSLIEPTNNSNVTIGNVAFYAEANDTSGLANFTIYIWNSTDDLVHSGTTDLDGGNNSTLYTVVPLPRADNYTWTFSAMDNLSNVGFALHNYTFNYNDLPPEITINDPTAQTYTVNSVSVDISLNEAGYCEYSLDSGTTNSTLTAGSGNISYTGTATGLSNGNYVLIAYCNDTSGKTNYTETVSFAINVASGGNTGGGGGGGGGSTCTVTSSTCGAWSQCISGERQRECTNNCGSTYTEKQDCVSCIDECASEGSECLGDRAITCSLVDGCLKITGTETCESGCLDGICLALEDQESPAFEGIFDFSGLSGFGGLVGECVVKPSKCIPHGDIPDALVDAGVYGGGTLIFLGLLWWIVLAIIASIVPFFLIKLRHYSLAVLDSNNTIGICNNGKIDRHSLLEFLTVLERNYNKKLVFAAVDEEVIKFVFNSGFVEIGRREPFTIVGHFTSKKKAKEFEMVLRKTLNQSGAKHLQILKTVEKASIIGAFRYYMRKRKSEKELGKLFRK